MTFKVPDAYPFLFARQITNATGDQADTYRFFATNIYGRAVCTTTLNVTDGELVYEDVLSLLLIHLALLFGVTNCCV